MALQNDREKMAMQIQIEILKLQQRLPLVRPSLTAHVFDDEDNDEG